MDLCDGELSHSLYSEIILKIDSQKKHLTVLLFNIHSKLKVICLVLNIDYLKVKTISLGCDTSSTTHLDSLESLQQVHPLADRCDGKIPFADLLRPHH